MLAAGLVDVLAADNHGDARTLADPFARLVEAGAEDVAIGLTMENPRAILSDTMPERIAGFVLKVPLLNRLKGWIGEMGQ